MVEFTFLEVHLDGAEFTANAPFSDTNDDDTDKSAAESEGSTGGLLKKGLLAFAAVTVLALGVVVIRRVVGGSVEDTEE